MRKFFILQYFDFSNRKKHRCKNSASTASHSARKECPLGRGIQLCNFYDRETFTSFFFCTLGDHSEIRTRNIGVRSNRLYRGGTQGPDSILNSNV